MRKGLTVGMSDTSITRWIRLSEKDLRWQNESESWF